MVSFENYHPLKLKVINRLNNNNYCSFQNSDYTHKKTVYITPATLYTLMVNKNVICYELKIYNLNLFKYPRYFKLYREQHQNSATILWYFKKFKVLF